MAAGPFVGATILEAFAGVIGPYPALTSPAWRWVFYLAVPFALLAGLYIWAAARGWRNQPGSGRLDVIGAALFTSAVTLGLLALTLVGDDSGIDPLPVAMVAGVALAVALLRFARARDPFLDLRHFRDRTFSGAVLMSLLTGYPLATASVGGAVFIDRVRYAGPSEQQVVLGALAGAMAIGALGAGYLVRPLGVMIPSLAGLLAEIGGLVILSTARPESGLDLLALGMAIFGLGFGVTVTARTAGALEALGSRAFGVGSAALTVARMLGMAVGLAALTVLGSNRIEALSVVLTDQAARDAVLPLHLQGRPLEDYLVVDALEAWAAGQAAGILSTLFLIAAAVAALAIIPTLAMRNRPGADLARVAEPDDAEDSSLDSAASAGLAM